MLMSASPLQVFDTVSKFFGYMDNPSIRACQTGFGHIIEGLKGLTRFVSERFSSIQVFLTGQAPHLGQI